MKVALSKVNKYPEKSFSIDCPFAEKFVWLLLTNIVRIKVHWGGGGSEFLKSTSAKSAAERMRRGVW